ncbi:MAG: acetylglutamate kinase [Acidobacteriota bacterium]
MTALTVVKIGGSLLNDEKTRASALKSIADRWRSGGETVLVHGGGKNIDRALSRAGIISTFVQGLRVTDEATLEIAAGVLSGYLNKTLVAELAQIGVAAAGISGADGQTLGARFHPDVDGQSLGFVGEVVSSNPRLVQAILRAHLLPVVSSIAVNSDSAQLLNVNADSAAAALAASLQASKLVFLTDVEGLLDAQGSVVPALQLAEAQSLLGSKAVTGGMRPKLLAAIDALRRGVTEVIIAGPSRHGSSLSQGIGGTHLVAA